jgi:hypothetical protein
MGIQSCFRIIANYFSQRGCRRDGLHPAGCWAIFCAGRKCKPGNGCGRHAGSADSFVVAGKLIYLGNEALNLFKDLPSEGVLVPYLSSVRAGDWATEFGQRCRRLGILGVSLHSLPLLVGGTGESCRVSGRFAQEALGHNSKAVHRANAKRALMKLPSLEDYEWAATVKDEPAI